MGTAGIISIVLASVLALLFIIVRVSIGQKNTQGGVIAMLTKAVASLGFISIGIAAIYQGVYDVQAAVFVLFGLVMGIIGDIVLDLKVIHLGSKEEGIYLTAGMTSFAIGHIFFFVAMLLYLGSIVNGALIGISVAVAAVLSAAVILVGIKVLKFKFEKFLVHSIVYAFILIFMGAFSVGVCIVMKNTDALLFAVGMVLFFLSDIVLTQMYFGGKPKDKPLTVVNHVLYYAAQICIASFIFFM